jgi:tripeptide aminopeptidase
LGSGAKNLLREQTVDLADDRIRGICYRVSAVESWLLNGDYMRRCTTVVVVVLISLAVMTAMTGQFGIPGDAKASEPTTSIPQQITSLVGSSSVHDLFRWFHEHTRDFADWQLEITGIPAPPFGEGRRAEWFKSRFEQLGLEDVHVDGEGNVLGIRRGTDRDAKYVMISAHMDTVFPAGTTLDVHRDQDKLIGPGISDNGAGLIAMLAIAAALHDSPLPTTAPILFVANVGEEGEGNLRGVRHIFSDPRWKDRIGYTVVLDGGGSDSIVSEGLGSRRFVITVKGPGGHSWSDFGTPNPIVVLARAIDQFSRVSLPLTPKTTANIGMISGGTSINAIPESATIKVDIRSSAAPEIERIERALRAALEHATAEYRAPSKTGDNRPLITYEMKLIGNRPAAELPADSRILKVVRAVDAQLRIPTRIQRASTDANVPLSLGLQALTLGGGGTGGGAHTLHEWYDPANRELGLKRILLSVLALAGVSQ